MEEAIYKYPLYIKDQQVLEMPEGATILTAQVQNGLICLWAAVYRVATLENRIIEVYGTGNPFSGMDKRKYISTVQLDGFVWHIFEVLSERWQPNWINIKQVYDTGKVRKIFYGM